MNGAIAFIACGHAEIAPDECTSCGFWLSSVTPGGFPGPIGRVCSEDCAADAQARIEEQDRSVHLHARDLMCSCPICASAGHPTAAEVGEYRAYQAGIR